MKDRTKLFFEIYHHKYFTVSLEDKTLLNYGDNCPFTTYKIKNKDHSAFSVYKEFNNIVIYNE